MLRCPALHDTGGGHHLQHLVVHARVKHARHKAGPDALDFVRPGAAAGQHRALAGLNSHHMEALLLLLQVGTSPRDRPARAHAAHQHVHLCCTRNHVGKANAALSLKTSQIWYLKDHGAARAG